MSTAAAAEARPTVDEVATLVADLVASEWPTTDEERAAWFERHGIVVGDVERVREEHGSESFHSRSVSASWPAVGWHVFEGEFVGVSWFLWHGLGEDVVPRLARELRDRFVDLAGEPDEEQLPAGDDYRFTAWWQTGGRSIDMYLHGGPVLSGEIHERPVVQLHVDHVERARLADEAASRHDAGPGTERPARPDA